MTEEDISGGGEDDPPKPEAPAEKPAEEPEKPPVKDFPLTSDCEETALELSSLMAMLLAGAVVLAKKKHD